jgi:large subunit ribosomal protein L21
MYAVIRTGGKQQKVQAGDVIEIELLQGGPGDKITFQPILVVDDDGATHYGKETGRAVVTAKLLGEKKGDKIKVFKYRPKTGYAKKQGHRQMLTLVEIEDIKLPARRGGTRREAEEAPEAEASQAEAAPVEETASPDEAPAKPAGRPRKAAASAGDAEETV